MHYVDSLSMVSQLTDQSFVQDVGGGTDEENDGEDEAEPMTTLDDKEETTKETNGLTAKKKNKLDRLFARKNNDVLSSAFDKIRAHDDDESDGEDNSDADEFLTKKRPREQGEADEFLTKKKPKSDAEEVEGKAMKMKRWDVIQCRCRSRRRSFSKHSLLLVHSFAYSPTKVTVIRLELFSKK